MNWLTQWFVYGICCNLFIIAAEVTVYRQRGIQPSPSDNSTPTALSIFIMLMLWPLPLYMWCRAAWERKTLGEYMADRRAAEQQATLKRLRDFRAQAREASKLWVGSHPRIGYVYVQRHGKTLFPSHWVVLEKEGFVIRRIVTDDMRAALIAGIEDTEEAAKAFCEQDVEWMALCVPGASGDRHRVVRALSKGTEKA